MPTVPIPTVIVGDTDTLRKRCDDVWDSLAATASTLGSALNAGQDTGTYCLPRIAELTVSYDDLMREIRRRRRAWKLANPKGLA